MGDFTVKIIFRNKKLEPVCEKQFALSEYTETVKYSLLRTIMDIEKVFSELQGVNGRNEWRADAEAQFQKIRHKILDEANAIERLPKNLYFKGLPCSAVSASETLAEIIDGIADKPLA